MTIAMMQPTSDRKDPPEPIPGGAKRGGRLLQRCRGAVVVAASIVALSFARGASRGWTPNQGLDVLWWTAFPATARDTLAMVQIHLDDREPLGAGVTTWTSVALDLQSISIGRAARGKPPIIRTLRRANNWHCEETGVTVGGDVNSRHRFYQLVPEDAFCSSFLNLYHVLYTIALQILGAAAEGGATGATLVSPANTAAGILNKTGELQIGCSDETRSRWSENGGRNKQILLAGLGLAMNSPHIIQHARTPKSSLSHTKVIDQMPNASRNTKLVIGLTESGMARRDSGSLAAHHTGGWGSALIPVANVPT